MFIFQVATKPVAVPPKFLFTGMGQQEKIDYSALIEQLGGEVKDAQYFDATCTHIIVGKPQTELFSHLGLMQV